MSFFIAADEVEDRWGNTHKEERLRIGRIVAVVVAFVVLLAAIFTCFKVVDTGKIAVVTRFGNVVSVEGQGFHVKTPIDHYNIIDVTQQQVTATYSTATKDNQSVNQEVTAQIVVDPENADDLYKKFLGNHMDGIVAPVLADGIKAATANYSLEGLIEKRGELSADMLKAVQDRLAAYGIKVVSMEVKNVELPEEYKAAVERKKVAEQDQETAKVKNETCLLYTSRCV